MILCDGPTFGALFEFSPLFLFFYSLTFRSLFVLKFDIKNLSQLHHLKAIRQTARFSMIRNSFGLVCKRKSILYSYCVSNVVGNLRTPCATKYYPCVARLLDDVGRLSSRRRCFSSEATVNSKENKPSKRSVEEQYSRKTPLEHVLLRPGMVGSISTSHRRYSFSGFNVS